MDLHSRILSHFNEAFDVYRQSEEILAQPLVDAIKILYTALVNNNKILACGNGGSASDAQHFVAELVGRLEQERLPLAAIALNTDTSLLTAIANDYGFEEIFERQVNALGQAGDVLLCLSTSGHSPNVLRAAKAAHERDMSIIALTGKGGGPLAQLMTPNDVHLCVPHHRTMRIQEIHILLLHILCDGIDACLLGNAL